MGGPFGVVGTTVPQLVFAGLSPHLPLLTTAGVSAVVAVGFTVVRLVRGEALSTAIGGVLGVAIASGIAVWTGSASNFFLVGIVAALVGFVVAGGSLAVRRPLTGLVWNLRHGGGHPWREDRPSRRAHDVATAAVAAVFGARFVVTQWLYALDSTGGLAVARVVLGVPLTLVAAAVVVWAFRRSTRRLVTRAAAR
ncbi:DUF3159 domain-containing protein [Actinomycetospora cinnamomea]|uniref:DUF3159 domain-containing protein n=1 Tax=Actinomycetospora cinnamomea TaxID=663609 RepID=UPI001FAF557D|nr:DUF3159 domain-containing protein [Actinomycetospora cinnamomea]